MDNALIDIICRAQAGDKEAFGELYTRFWNMVFFFLLRKGIGHEDSKDLCQSVFVRAQEKINQLKSPYAWQNWLLAIATNLTNNWFVRGRPSFPELSLSFELGKLAHPGTSMERAEHKEAVQQILPTLRDIDREVLVAFYWQGHSIIDISKMLGVPQGTVKRRLHVARKRAGKKFKKAGLGRP